jgi:two-component system chemotaxis sensor kinase CheA
MDEFLEQFLIEARELVEQATADLLALEQSPNDRARLDSAFRAFHTLKGAAGIVDFAAMQHLTHAAEDRLAGLRAGTSAVSRALTDDCLACLDQITAWLEVMEETGGPPEDAAAAADALAARLGAAPETKPAGPPAEALAILGEQFALIDLPPDAAMPGRLGSAARVIGNVLQHLGLSQDTDIAALLAPLRAAVPTPTAPAPEPPARPAREQNAERIDTIVKLAGELNVLKNALGHAIQSDSAQLPRLHMQLQRLVSELLTQSLGARVLPLRHVFQRFPRLVREIAAGLGKPVRLVTAGDATEADRAVVEQLFEPILHVLRNAVDHGIEPPERRRALTKPEPATITLTAGREGDRVVIEVADDGAGIDPSFIRQAAAARGLATPAALDTMPDTRVQELIFAPGFSTRGDVTALSGRGVGMDAVRSAVERLGGRVALRSTPGQGTAIRFILPFSVILTRVLLAEAGGQAFGIPFEAVAETLELAPERIVRVGAAQAFVHRARTVPLLHLAELLGLPASPPAGPLPVAILNGEAALSVERFGESLEIMLKPAGGLLSGMGWIAGTALLGDGSVLIVLELSELL